MTAAPRDQIGSKIRGWRQTGGQIAHGVLRARDPEQAFSEASLLVEAAQAVASDAGRARALAVERIKVEGRLTGPQVAEILGISQQRVYQLLDVAKATRADGTS